MASAVLSKVNFIRFVKMYIDVLKLSLVDILASEIQAIDLYNKIQHSCSLLKGKNQLNPMQRSICFLKPPAIPDYKQFDVTLLYKLIRSLCPSLEPTKGWGKDPVDADILIGDDIERLRTFRKNNMHNGLKEISDSDFETIWKKLESVLQRIENHMTSKGYSVNYGEKMTNIKQLDLEDELTEKYKVEYIVECVFRHADYIEEPMISIEGPSNVLCGDTAKFNAVMNPENLKDWSITWLQIIERTHIRMRINWRTEKYSGSTDKNLVIQSVCKKDEGKYQAILSGDLEGKYISVSSNVIFLQAIGELPIFDVWNVTTGMEGIRIHYSVKKMAPYVNEIKWTKDGVPISTRNKKYNGGELNDNHITITSPTVEDKGNYSCVVKNAVGSVQKEVNFDVPNVEISTEHQVYFGSKTSITTRIVSCPSPDRVDWQESNDGKKFTFIIISKLKYNGSSCDPKSPLLVIPKVTFEDKRYYRLLVWNKIGEQHSNTVYLDVKGSPPNITTSHKACVSKRSITLIGNVFVYRNLHVQNVFWTKNGVRLDTQGSGGKYTDVTVVDPSLTILEVNEHDAGSYQLTATNAVGSTTSGILILGIPDVSMGEPEIKEDGTHLIPVTIESIPAPYFVQWKEKHGDEYIPINVNHEKYKGTLNSLTHPVLIVSQLDELKKYWFQIEVCNFIGSSKKTKIIDLTLDDQTTTNPYSHGNHYYGNKSKRKTRKEEPAATALDSRPHEKTGPFSSLDLETSERIPTEQELASVSKYIGPGFNLIGVQLGLSDVSIDHIRMTYRECTQTQILKMLLSWKNKDGRQATIRKLLQAVNCHSNTANVLDIERIFQCDKNDGSTNH